VDASLVARISVRGTHIRASLDGGPVLEIEDGTYEQGKIGLMADVPTNYHHVRVITTAQERQRIDGQIEERLQEAKALQAANPKPVHWKTINTEGFGVGRNLRFGDLNGDGQMDILIGQVRHHGPKDRNSELSCLTAVTLDGEVL
jgi:rhamnogalacturonan endolyase